MDFAFTEEQQQLHAKFRQIGRDLVSPGARQRDEDAEFDRALWRRLAETGFFGLHMPKEYGGGGRGIWEFAAALEGFAEGCEDFGFLISVAAQVGLAQSAIIGYGNDEQKAYWLPRLISGESIAAFAITERQGGSDVRRIKLQAGRDAAGTLCLDGEKWNITNIPVADVCVLFARFPEAGEKDITAFLAPLSGDKVEMTGPLDLMGNRGTPTGHVRFYQKPVGDSAMLGRPGGGMEVLYFGFLVERVLVGLTVMGYLRPVINEAMAWAMKREAFLKKIADFQYVQERILKMRVNLELLHGIVYRSLWHLSRGEDCTLQASVSKLFAAESLGEATLDAIRVLGNYGYRKECDLERKCREAIGLHMAGGTAEIHKYIIWERMCDEFTGRHRESPEARPGLRLDAYIDEEVLESAAVA